MTTPGPTVTVRADLAASHRRAFERLARAGTWWTGAERVAIAAEARAARSCALCRARKAALSPAAVAGRHDAAGTVLADAAVDAAHRIASDPGRLTRAVVERLLSEGLSDGAYVELVGIVAQTVCIDTFRRALGLAAEPLPAPEPGEPSRRRPAGLRAGDGFVPRIDPSAAAASEADLFPGGRGPEVVRALSLVPDAVRAVADLSAAQYVPFERVADVGWSPRALSRAQIELVAGRVSALNECFY